jgi:hypothetical protein
MSGCVTALRRITIDCPGYDHQSIVVASYFYRLLGHALRSGELLGSLRQNQDGWTLFGGRAHGSFNFKTKSPKPFPAWGV